jgi:DNA polymerase-3 subunit delta'
MMDKRAFQLKLLYESFETSRVQRFAAAERLTQDPEALPDLLQLWLGWWRDLLLVATVGHAGQSINNVDQVEQIKDLAQLWPAEDILSYLRRTEGALWQLERNANTRLVLENLLLGYPTVQLAIA